MPTVCFADTMMTRPPFGGPNTFLIDLVTRLPSFGWDVTLIAGEQLDKTYRQTLELAGVRVECSLLARGLLPEQRAERIANWLKENAQNVFVVSNCRDASWLTLPMLPHNVRTVSIAHADLSAYLNPAHYYAPFLDRMVGVSQTITNHLGEGCKIHADRCRYIPYGVRTLPAEQFKKTETENVRIRLNLGYVGRVVNELKRVLSLPLFLKQLQYLGVDFHFHVIGDGSARQSLEKLLVENGLYEQVTFHGWLSGDELSCSYTNLDIYVLFSETEGLPIALLEAMGHGCVPVVSDIDSGMRKVVQDGFNGFLVPYDDVMAQANAIHQLNIDRPLLAQMSRASWTTAQDYTSERMAEAYNGLFHELLEVTDRRPLRPAEPYPPMPSCRSRYPYWARKIKAWLLGSH